MAGPWYCQHLWEHYRYTGDVTFLQQRAYPHVIKMLNYGNGKRNAFAIVS